MQNSPKNRLRNAVEITVAFVPWVIAMYVFYWLDSSGTWTSDTAHRGKLSVVLLAGGMGASFLLHSYLAGRKRP